MMRMKKRRSPPCEVPHELRPPFVPSADFVNVMFLQTGPPLFLALILAVGARPRRR